MTDATIRNDHKFALETLPVSLEDEMRKSYLDYAMSVIVGRALPDVRDGLKPVHRRVLYAMHELKNNWNSAYKKSARIVGDVIGKYHPHGDIAVYDTIVRMAQDFSMRYVLIDGQGNFGSVDGLAAAAMRYTEIRMEKISHEMLADIEEETVNFGPNYDGTLILVSHDRDFLDGLVSKVYEFGGGKVTEHLEGIYEFMQRKKLENLKELERSAS